MEAKRPDPVAPTPVKPPAVLRRPDRLWINVAVTSDEPSKQIDMITAAVIRSFFVLRIRPL